jgi:hypothetical protein
MKQVDFNTYKKLLEAKSLSKSTIPVSVLRSAAFKGLLRAKILYVSKVGRGLKIGIAKEDRFQQFFQTKFPEQDTLKSKAGNVRKFRNSKAAKIDSNPVFLFRGFTPISLNKNLVDVTESTQKFGLLAAIPNSIICKKVCFVENLEPFLQAEKLLGKDYLFVHKYGRIGEESIAMFEADEFLVFVDYDFNGLDEYLRIKNVFANAALHMPKNYEELYGKYSKTLKGNKAKMSKAVQISTDETVVKIREQVARNNKYLEQEVLIYDTF